MSLLNGLDFSILAAEEAGCTANKAEFALDAEGRITHMNEEAGLICGCNPYDARGRPLGDVVELSRHGLPVDLDAWLTEVLQAGSIRSLDECCLALLDGQRRHLAGAIAPSRDREGRPIGATVVCSDVTYAQKQRQRLLDSHEWLRQTMLSADIGLIDYNMVKEQITVNDLYFRMLGYDDRPAGTYPIAEWESLTEPSDLQRALAAVRDHMEGRSDQYRCEFRMRTAEDQWKWVLAIGRIVERDPNGQPTRMLAQHIDIDESKRTSEALRESREWLDGITEGANIGVWDYWPPKGNFWVNAQYFSMLGFPPQPGKIVEITEWLETMHPDDRDRARRTLEPYVRGESNQYENHFRMRTSDGGWKWILSRSLADERDENGYATRILGVHLDIDRSKRASDALRTREQTMQSIFRSAPIGIGLTKNRVIQQANDLFCDMLGYDREEFLGRSSRMLYESDEEFERVGKVKYEQIMKYGTGSVETRMVRKDGGIIHILLSSTPLDLGDLSKGVTFTALDITDRVRDAKALNDAHEALKRYSENLEEKVARRTSELQSKNESLAQTLDELRSAQSQLVQSERLAMLGQLSAGIAHEINTPLGAIGSAGHTIHSMLSRVMQSVDSFVEMKQGEQGTLVDELLQRVLHQESREHILSSRERRRLRDNLIPSLEESDVSDARRVAEILIELQLNEDFSKFIPLLICKKGLQALELLRDVATIHRSTQIVSLATTKASRIVQALRSYARRSHAGRMEPVDLRENIDTVLLLYENHMKREVELIRSYDETPPIEGLPEELGQVWTNLIHNALQAMDFRGELRVAICNDAENGRVCVEIHDSGAGIAEEVLPKIFEPFFTTKPAGAGTGLGLDIVRNIVERHNGAIAVESEVGVGTSFVLTFPIPQEANPD